MSQTDTDLPLGARVGATLTVVAKRGRRGPLTGLREPEWSSEEPWQVQQAARSIRGLARGDTRSRQGVRLLVLLLLSFAMVIVVGALVINAF